MFFFYILNQMNTKHQRCQKMITTQQMIVGYNPNWMNKWINYHLSEISSSRNVVCREQEVTAAADEQQTSGTAGDQVSL